MHRDWTHHSCGPGGWAHQGLGTGEGINETTYIYCFNQVKMASAF